MSPSTPHPFSASIRVHRRFQPAFTLVELLVVIAIIAVLLAITVPTLARARAAARNVASVSDLRQLTLAYLMYAQNNRGTLLPGFLPDQIRGVAPTASDPISGHLFSGRAARQWPARLAESMGPNNNLYRLIRPTLGPSQLPLPSDTPAQAESKAYTAGLYPIFGLNTVYLGGHGASATTTDYYKGFLPDGTPNIGKHVAFKLTDVRRPVEQIVFTEVAIHNGSTSIDADNRAGLHYVTPPLADAASGPYWTASNNRITAALPATPRRTLGLPYSRSTANSPTPRIPTAFLDAHIETMSPKDLANPKLWSPKNPTPAF